MSVHSPITRQSIGRTFITSAIILGVVALVQLGTVTWAFIDRIRNPSNAAPPRKIDLNAFAEKPESAEPLSIDDNPLEGGPAPVPVPENYALNTAPRPTPVPLTALTPKVDSRFTELIEQGKLLRESGDTGGALVKFRDAQAVDPTNALPIAETAYTFEKMGLPDKAAEQWKWILSMGEGAGVYYTAAEAKLRATQLTTMKEAGGGPGGIAAGKTLGIGSPAIAEPSTPGGPGRFTLSVPIISKPEETISVRDAVTQVLFYDQVGRDIVRTTANVSYHWSTSPADWNDGGNEVLEVNYDLPATSVGEARKYFGYVVRLYYKGELQDTRADPPNLNQRFPAPYMLSKEN